MRPPESPDALWPAQPNAEWPRRCLIENVALHPRQPWLAVACTDVGHEADAGAVLLFDTQTGRVRSSTQFAHPVGWMENRDVMRWHPDGQRLITNESTNGITLLQLARVVGSAVPDETRDSGVHVVWVGDQLFADTGALFEIHDGDELFPANGTVQFNELEWNATIGAVVGRIGDGIAAFDPRHQRFLYRVPGIVKSRDSAWSADGRWYATVDRERAPTIDRIRVYSGDDGQLRGTVPLSLPHFQHLVWGPDGTLAVHCYAEARSQRTAEHVDIVDKGVLARTLDLASRRISATFSVPEAGGMAWSPTGDGLALLLDGQTVQIRETETGKILTSFSAPAPAIPKGLPDWYPGYDKSVDYPGGLTWLSTTGLARLAPHFVSFWSIDGHKLGEQVVRD